MISHRSIEIRISKRIANDEVGGIKKLTVVHRELKRNDILSIAEGEGKERKGMERKKNADKGETRAEREGERDE